MLEIELKFVFKVIFVWLVSLHSFKNHFTEELNLKFETKSKDFLVSHRIVRGLTASVGSLKANGNRNKNIVVLSQLSKLIV